MAVGKSRSLKSTCREQHSRISRRLAACCACRRAHVAAAVTVRMPSDKMFPDEQEMFEPGESQMAQTAKYRIVARLERQRMNCRLFLSQSGFNGAQDRSWREK